MGASRVHTPSRPVSRTGARRRGRPVSGWVAVTQKPRAGVQRGSPAAGRGARTHARAGAQSSLQGGRDLPDACSLLGASVGTSGTIEGPAARPPRPGALPACLPRPQDSVGVALCCGACSPRPPSPRTLWPLVLQGRQACRLGRAAGALPRTCVLDCRSPRGGVRLDGLQGAPGCRPMSARPQALGRCPWSFEGWPQAPGDRSGPCLPRAQGGSASPRV